MTTRKKRGSPKGTRKKTKLNPYVSDASRKITIEVNWNARDGGLSDFRNKRVFQFMTRNLGGGYNLIQTQPKTHFRVNGKSKLHLQAIKVTDWPVKVKWWKNDPRKWDEIKPLSCTAYNDWIKTMPCGQGVKREKIFAKLKSNEYVGGFATYLWRLFSGDIDEKKHIVFVKALKSTFKNKPLFIHNEDVSFFHAKEDTDQK